jgi:hypothetical protein
MQSDDIENETGNIGKLKLEDENNKEIVEWLENSAMTITPFKVTKTINWIGPEFQRIFLWEDEKIWEYRK